MSFFSFQELYKEVATRYAGKRDARFVEVGVWMGESASFLAKECCKHGDHFTIHLVDKFKGCELTGKYLPKIDPELSQTSSFIHKTVDNLHQSGMMDRFELIQSNSQNAARLIDDASCDFVFIDADHSYEAVRGDIAAWRPKVRSGGMLAGHDYDWIGVRKAVNERFSHVKIHTYPGNCWAIEIP